jgi:hypothetical protein
VTAARRAVAVIACSLALMAATASGALAAPKPVFPDVKVISLRTATSDAGQHPILRWKSVNGVTTYVVVVQTAKGAAYWSGRTTETKLRFGGGPLTAPKDAGAAELTKPMKWYVLGLDDAGDVVAASAKRRIAP